MKNELQLVTSDKVNWFKNHSISAEQRKKLIEDKVKRALNQVEFKDKTKVLFK